MARISILYSIGLCLYKCCLTFLAASLKMVFFYSGLRNYRL